MSDYEWAGAKEQSETNHLKRMHPSICGGNHFSEIVNDADAKRTLSADELSIAKQSPRAEAPTGLLVCIWCRLVNAVQAC